MGTRLVIRGTLTVREEQLVRAIATAMRLAISMPFADRLDDPHVEAEIQRQVLSLLAEHFPDLEIEFEVT